MEAAATPFPREETTPPVTKMYFGALCKGLDSLQENRYNALSTEGEGLSNQELLSR
jgi:hypothetical protein